MDDSQKRNDNARPWLRALGPCEPPLSIEMNKLSYQRERVFKHDFFAVTSLYASSAGKVILKIGRNTSVFGLPATWIGRVLAHHEARLYKIAQGVTGVPRLWGSWGMTGLIHDFVAGHSLSKEDALDDLFFPRLSAMLDALHQRGIAYVDLEKRENILVGDDGAPHLIDFQISWHVPANRGGNSWPIQGITRLLQASDRYHLFKHWRRLRPDQLPADAEADSARMPFWIRIHRLFFRPLTLLRRQILVWLGARSSIRVRSPG